MEERNNTNHRLKDYNINQYDSINELVIVGDFGFKQIKGPWEVEKEGTKWTVIIPNNDNSLSLSHDNEGCGAVLIADGEVIGGGIVDVVFKPEEEGEKHVVVDQYARGLDNE